MRTLTVLKNALFAKSGEEPAPVALPHTWNALDGQDGGSDYWRGTANYRIDLPEPDASYVRPVGENDIPLTVCANAPMTTTWSSPRASTP